jgi:hypothetical protein
MKQEKEDMRSDESGGLSTSKPRQPFEKMVDAIRESASDLARSDDEEDGEDDQDSELGKLSEDDEPSWMIGTILNMVPQRKERFWPMQMKPDTLTHLGWVEVADYFHE